MSRKALGRGLKALIPDSPSAVSIGVSLIPVDQISPNPYQPRKSIDEGSLAELVDSIKVQGLLQPVLVKRSAGSFELIAGERRWRAAGLAGLREIPALIKEVDREESLAMAIVENIQRENLNPIDSAMAYQSLADEFGLSQDQIATLVGKDRSSVSNYLRLLNLPLSIQNDLSEGRLSMGHARALLSISGLNKQSEARDMILMKGLSVREAEKLAKDKSRAKRNRHKAASSKDPHLLSVQEELKRRLGTKVTISSSGNSGTIQIHFHSPDELERLVEYLLDREKK